MIKEVDYSDQGITSSIYYDRCITSGYTEHGIKCIDEQYCRRIQNIHNKIIKIIDISVERMIASKGRYLSNPKIIEGLKAEISIDDFINKKWGGWGNELRITWENNYVHEFFYWDNVLVIDPKTGRENSKILKKDIEDNPHLHQIIKANLLDNLANYLAQN